MPRLSAQKVVVGGSLDSFNSSLPASSAKVEPALALLDGIGLSRVAGYVGGRGETEYYSLRIISAPSGSFVVPDQASAFIWEGKDFAPLSGSDPRRAFDNRYLYLVVYSMVPNSSGVPATVEGTPSAVGHETGAPTYFLIRL